MRLVLPLLLACMLPVGVGAGEPPELITSAPDKCGTQAEIEADLNRAGMYWSWSGLTQGTISTGDHINLYLTHDGSTWAMTFPMEDGTTCVVILGDGWRTVKPGERH